MSAHCCVPTNLQYSCVLIVAQKNKATSYHLGLLKAKLAKLRRELLEPKGGGGGGGGLGFDVARTGIASVGFVGFPSVGKVCRDDFLRRTYCLNAQCSRLSCQN